MKIKNIFKKGKQNESKTNVQTLDKKQLEKVIGGADTSTTAQGIIVPVAMDKGLK